MGLLDITVWSDGQWWSLCLCFQESGHWALGREAERTDTKVRIKWESKFWREVDHCINLNFSPLTSTLRNSNLTLSEIFLCRCRDIVDIDLLVSPCAAPSVLIGLEGDHQTNYLSAIYLLIGLFWFLIPLCLSPLMWIAALCCCGWLHCIVLYCRQLDG